MNLEYVKEMCKKLKPVIGNKADALFLTYLTEDYEGKKEIIDLLEILAVKKLNQNLSQDQILLNPPKQEICKGDYQIGNVFYNDKELYSFALREEEMIQHIGIFGRSGSGKTNIGFLLIKELIKRNKPFLIFDWKRNYRNLDENILIFTPGRDIVRFYFNPLIPPKGTLATVWLKKLIEIIAHSYFLGEGVMYLLQKAIHSTYKQFGIYSGKQVYPTMHDVLSYLENYKAKGRELLWIASALRAISSLCYGEMGKLLNTKENIMEKLLEQNVILELDSLTNADKVFLIESILLWIHHYRLQEKGNFKHAILIEEAHQILLRQKQELKGNESITDIILREIRELGEGIILIDQHPSLISIPALGNTYCTIAMNLKHRNDVTTISDSMLLDNDQKDYLGQLETGKAIVKLQSRYMLPFLITVPLIKEDKNISDFDIKRRMSNFHGYSYSGFSQPPNNNHEFFGVFRAEDIREEEKRLLQDIIERPYASISSRYKRLKLTGDKGNSLKNSLLKQGLITIKEITTPNAQIKVMELTNKARNFLNIPLKQETESTEHRYWKNKIAEYYEKLGYKVDMEQIINGKPDIIITNQDKKTAIEIETGKSNILANILKSINSFDLLIIVATSKEAEEKIKDIIAYFPSEKIKLVSTKGFYRSDENGV